MGQIKELLLTWMNEKGLHQEDLDEMKDVDAEFKKWLPEYFNRIKLN